MSGESADSWRWPVDLETVPRAVYFLIGELLAELAADPAWRRVHSRGPAPTLRDAEVQTMEGVGEFLGYDQDVGLYASNLMARWACAARPLSPRTRFNAHISGLSESLYSRMRRYPSPLP
jgi:hypothetical protein